MENVLVTEKSSDYELLDSGDEEKLERYGSVILSRPDPQAIWKKNLVPERWQEARAIFNRNGASGKWKIERETPDPWRIHLNGLTFNLKLNPSKHVGVFPEQSAHWKWLEEKIKKDFSGQKLNILNLFGHTGGASLACARAGAKVTHVDSSKFVVDFAHKNLIDSGLYDKPVRFIVDDCRKFVEREIRRKSKYDVIILDPPVYGKGKKGEIWKIEKDLPDFVLRLKGILSAKPTAIVLNGYSSSYSNITYAQILSPLVSDLGGEVSSGELGIRESSSSRILPSGIFARWEK